MVDCRLQLSGKKGFFCERVMEKLLEGRNGIVKHASL